MTDHYNTEFERVLKDERTDIKTRDIPNTRFRDGVFTIGDYFDMESFKETFTGTVEDEMEWVDWAFEPLETYLGGVPEISVTRGHGDMYWCDVTVELPEDQDRQTLLAHLVADAWKRRTKR